MWFTERVYNKVGTISTTGAPVERAGSRDYGGPTSITAGPDGALWFTANGAIGRVTTTGSFRYFPLADHSSAINADITRGPDGNLWFTSHFTDEVGRITPAGAVTRYKLPTSSARPYGITAGSDGNLWVAESHGNKLARVSTAGAITEFTLPGIGNDPRGITSGPDGNLWFAQGVQNRIGKAIIAVPASVAGTVFNDADGDAVKDTGEAGIANRRLYIDADKDGVFDSTEKSTLTDSAGNYKFTGLAAGTYRVRVVVQGGLRLTTPTGGVHTLTLGSGTVATGKNFGAR